MRFVTYTTSVAALSVDGENIYVEGQTEYEVESTYSEGCVVVEGEFKTSEILYDESTGTASITLSDGTSEVVYTVNFHIYAGKLSSLVVGQTSLLADDQTDYTIEAVYDAAKLSYAGDYKNVTLDYDEATQTATITAQGTSQSTTYTIAYYQRSGKLASLIVGGENILAGDVVDYTFEGIYTDGCIEYDGDIVRSQFSYDESTNTATIWTFGTESATTYTVEFYQYTSTLSALKVGGVDILTEGETTFSAEAIYTEGCVVAEGNYKSIAIDYADDVVTINVVGSADEAVYTINLYHYAGTLSALSVGEVEILESDVTSYDVEALYDIEAISYEGDYNAVEISYDAAANVATLTAKGTASSTTYTLNYFYYTGELSSLTINEVELLSEGRSAYEFAEKYEDVALSIQGDYKDYAIAYDDATGVATITTQGSDAQLEYTVQFFLASTAEGIYQFTSPDFEDWDSVEAEWNDYSSAKEATTASWSNMPSLGSAEGYNSNTCLYLYSTSSSYYAYVAAIKKYYVNAAGIATTGQFYLGNTTYTKTSDNYVRTAETTSGNYLLFAGRPDGVKFQSKFTAGTGNDAATASAIFAIHQYVSAYNYSKTAYTVSQATFSISESTDWVSNYQEFEYSDDYTDIDETLYLLATFATTESQGTSYNDYLYIDDVYFVYNHELTAISYDDVELDLDGGTLRMTQPGEPDLSKLTMTTNSNWATTTAVFDKNTNRLLVTVLGNDYAVNAESRSDYVFPVELYYPAALESLAVNGDEILTEGATDYVYEGIYADGCIEATGYMISADITYDADSQTATVTSVGSDETITYTVQFCYYPGTLTELNYNGENLLVEGQNAYTVEGVYTDGCITIGGQGLKTQLVSDYDGDTQSVTVEVTGTDTQSTYTVAFFTYSGDVEALKVYGQDILIEGQTDYTLELDYIDGCISVLGDLKSYDINADGEDVVVTTRGTSTSETFSLHFHVYTAEVSELRVGEQNIFVAGQTDYALEMAYEAELIEVLGDIKGYTIAYDDDTSTATVTVAGTYTENVYRIVFHVYTAEVEGLEVYGENILADNQTDYVYEGRYTPGCVNLVGDFASVSASYNEQTQTAAVTGTGTNGEAVSYVVVFHIYSAALTSLTVHGDEILVSGVTTYTYEGIYADGCIAVEGDFLSENAPSVVYNGNVATFEVKGTETSETYSVEFYYYTGELTSLVVDGQNVLTEGVESYDIEGEYVEGQITFEGDYKSAELNWDDDTLSATITTEGSQSDFVYVVNYYTVPAELTSLKIAGEEIFVSGKTTYNVGQSYTEGCIEIEGNYNSAEIVYDDESETATITLSGTTATATYTVLFHAYTGEVSSITLFGTEILSDFDDDNYYFYEGQYALGCIAVEADYAALSIAYNETTGIALVTVEGTYTTNVYTIELHVYTGALTAMTVLGNDVFEKGATTYLYEGIYTDGCIAVEGDYKGQPEISYSDGVATITVETTSGVAVYTVTFVYYTGELTSLVIADEELIVEGQNAYSYEGRYTAGCITTEGNYKSVEVIYESDSQTATIWSEGTDDYAVYTVTFYYYTSDIENIYVFNKDIYEIGQDTYTVEGIYTDGCITVDADSKAVEISYDDVTQTAVVTALGTEANTTATITFVYYTAELTALEIDGVSILAEGQREYTYEGLYSAGCITYAGGKNIDFSYDEQLLEASITVNGTDESTTYTVTFFYYTGALSSLKVSGVEQLEDDIMAYSVEGEYTEGSIVIHGDYKDYTITYDDASQTVTITTVGSRTTYTYTVTFVAPEEDIVVDNREDDDADQDDDIEDEDTPPAPSQGDDDEDQDQVQSQTPETEEGNDEGDIIEPEDNAISAVTIDANTRVNVYDLSGHQLRHNVKRTDALQDLPRGIYIVGHEKILKK